MLTVSLEIVRVSTLLISRWSRHSLPQPHALGTDPQPGWRPQSLSSLGFLLLGVSGQRRDPPQSLASLSPDAPQRDQGGTLDPRRETGGTLAA